VSAAGLGIDWRGRTFRANPGYELVLLDRLPPEERRELGSLADSPDLYGVLRPRPGSPLGPRAVDRDTALLFLTLAEPGPLPSYLHGALGAEAGRVVARLTADLVLEVERDGAFVSGPAALAPLPARAAGEAGSGAPSVLAALSLAALRHAARLAVSDPTLLARRLYVYNGLPLTPDWKRRLPGPAATGDYLGLGPGGAHRGLLERRWGPPRVSRDWLRWDARGPAGARAELGPGAVYKLYLSPLPGVLPQHFGAILAALAAGRASRFKVGAGAAGLLRADKLVAYFGSFEQLAAAAGQLTARLAGMPGQGVPFTAEIAAPLLSWGVDPPRAGASERERSWRAWLTERLARAILAGRAAGSPEPWRFALERLEADGVDAASWAPRDGLWSAA
jgi:hypothetical protein